MEELIISIPKCVFFIDGNKDKRWCPKSSHGQERAYDRYKKRHMWSILVYSDLFGRFISLEISDKGAKSHRYIYTCSDVYRRSGDFSAGEQHGMANMGFAGMVPS